MFSIKLILTTRLMSDAIVRRQKKQKRKTWRPEGAKVTTRWGMKCDTFPGDKSETGGEVGKVFV